MSIAVTKTGWSVEQWAAFAARAGDVCHRLWWAIKATERIPGITVRVGDGLLDVERHLQTCMCSLEDLCEDNTGVNPIGLLNDPWRTPVPTPLPAERFEHLPESQCLCPRPRGTVLSLEAWEIEGRHWKAMRAVLFSLIVDLNAAFPKTRIKRAEYHLRRADGRLTRARSLMECLLVKQHPDVRDPASFFFGKPHPRAEEPACHS